MRTGRHLAEKVQQVLVEQGVFGKQGTEMGELLRIGQVSVNQEPRGLGEGGLFGQVLDGVAPVTQNPVLAIHIGNGALGAARVQVAVIEGNQSGIFAQRTDIETGFVLGAFDNRELVALSIIVQCCLFGH